MPTVAEPTAGGAHFANLEQGDIAKSEDLIEAFGTDNEDVVCVEVLNKGEFQVSEEERQAQVEQLFKDVAARVTDMCDEWSSFAAGGQYRGAPPLRPT